MLFFIVKGFACAIIKQINKSEFVERFLELSLFYGLSSPLNSEMICIFPYFCPYAMTDSYLLFTLRNYAAKLIEKETSPKYYFMDTGLLGLMLLDCQSAQLENLVAIELVRRYGIENVYFFENNVEIDFYVPSEQLAIQVSMQILDNIDTKERETKAFTKLKNFIPDITCLLITNSEEAVLECNDIVIDVVPAWKWLLDAADTSSH